MKRMMKAYDDFYLKCDVLLLAELADVFEKVRIAYTIMDYTQVII